MNKTIDIFGQSVTFNNAYFAIIYFSGDKKGIDISLQAFTDSSRQQAIGTPLSYHFIPEVTDSSANFIKQGYDYIKSLPEFNGAIDVLETGQTA